MNKDTQILIDAIEFIERASLFGVVSKEAVLADYTNGLTSFLKNHPLNKGLFRKQITAADVILVLKTFCKGSEKVCPYVEKLP